MSSSINCHHFISLLVISCCFSQDALSYELGKSCWCIMSMNIKLLAISICSCAYVNKVLFCSKLRLSVYVKGMNGNLFVYYLLQLFFWRVKWNVVRVPVVLSFWSSINISVCIVVWRSISNDYDLIHIICCINVMVCHLYCFFAYTAISIDTFQEIQKISGLAFERSGLKEHLCCAVIISVDS